MKSVTRRFPGVQGLMMLALAVLGTSSAKAEQQNDQTDWSFNATIIEACSCPMFCPCYFNTTPATHHEGHDGKAEHFCRFNRAFRINQGHYGEATLDGVKFWMAGDLGGDFSHDQVDWGVFSFEPSTTKQQRDAIRAILAYVYPVKWNSFAIGKDGAIEWKASLDHAEASL